MEGPLALGAKVEKAAEARACCPLSLRRMCCWRAAAPASTQRLVLLQTIGGLDPEETKTYVNDSKDKKKYIYIYFLTFLMFYQ